MLNLFFFYNATYMYCRHITYKISHNERLIPLYITREIIKTITRSEYYRYLILNYFLDLSYCFYIPISTYVSNIRSVINNIYIIILTYIFLQQCHKMNICAIHIVFMTFACNNILYSHTL